MSLKELILKNKNNKEFINFILNARKKFNIKSFKNLDSSIKDEFLNYIKDNLNLFVLNEISTTNSIAGYETPFAFTAPEQDDEDKIAVKIALKDGWKLVKEELETKINPKKQIANNIKEIKIKIQEIEKILLKSKLFKEQNKLTSNDFYKRTKNNLKFINEKILNIMNHIQGF